MEEAAEEALEEHQEKVEEKPDEQSLHEWIRLRESQGEALTGVEKAYRDMKKKKNGNVSIAEVVKFFMDLEPTRRPIWAQQLDIGQQNKLKKTLAKFDRNGDNELDFEEFLEWWHSHPGHEQAYGERGVHQLASADELATPKTPATGRGMGQGIMNI